MKVQYKSGGDTRDGNRMMLKNQAVEFKHHATELSNAVKKAKHVDAWVVAKAERATTDLSDITHYLDGQSDNYAKGGVTYIDARVKDTDYYRKYYTRYPNAIGSFQWGTKEGSKSKYYNLAEGILYPLDDFDREYYAHLLRGLRKGEYLFRYRTDRMLKDEKRLIKINLDKSLVYFMDSENMDEHDDKNIKFLTRGVEATYIVVEYDKLFPAFRYEHGGETTDDLSLSELSDAQAIQMANAIISEEIGSDDSMQLTSGYAARRFLREYHSGAADVDENEIVDYFSNADGLPDEVVSVIERYSDIEHNRDTLSDMRNELMLTGYNFDYDDDMIPHSLRRIDEEEQDNGMFADGGMMADGGISKRKTKKEKGGIMAKGGEISQEINSLLDKLEYASKNGKEDEFDKISNKIHEISDNQGLNESEYNRWDEIRSLENEKRISKFLEMASGGMMADGGISKRKTKKEKEEESRLRRMRKRFYVTIYHGGEMPKETKIFENLSDAREAAMSGEHSTILDLLTGEEVFANGGMMAKGGEVRKVKGRNFSEQIENNQRFKSLIQRVFDEQVGEKYPMEFIRATALNSSSIVKWNGKHHLRGADGVGVLSHYEFMDDPNFIKALDYVDRPKIRSMKNKGGMIKDGGEPYQKYIDSAAKDYFKSKLTNIEIENEALELADEILDPNAELSKPLEEHVRRRIKSYIKALELRQQLQGGASDSPAVVPGSVGDSALVVSENKLGTIVNIVSGVYYLRFVDGTTNRYLQYKLRFIKDEDDYSDEETSVEPETPSVPEYTQEKIREAIEALQLLAEMGDQEAQEAIDALELLLTDNETSDNSITTYSEDMPTDNEEDDFSITAYADDMDTIIGRFTSVNEAKQFAKDTISQYDEIVFEDNSGDTITVTQGDTAEDIDLLFSDNYQIAESNVPTSMQRLKSIIRDLARKYSGDEGNVLYMGSEPGQFYEIGGYEGLKPESSQANSKKLEVNFYKDNTQYVFSNEWDELTENRLSYEKYRGKIFLFIPMTNKIAAEIMSKVMAVKMASGGIMAKGGAMSNKKQIGEEPTLKQMKSELSRLEKERMDYLGSRNRLTERASLRTDKYQARIDKLMKEIREKEDVLSDKYLFDEIKSSTPGKDRVDKAAYVIKRFLINRKNKGLITKLSKFKQSLTSPSLKEAYRRLEYATWQKKYMFKLIISNSGDTIRVKEWYADGGMMSKGGATFEDKVTAISGRLEGTQVPRRLRSEYGRRYNKEEAKKAAQRIAGAMIKKGY